MSAHKDSQSPNQGGDGNGNGEEAAEGGVVAATEEHDRLAQPVDREEAPRLPFAVVGIGASAGGIEAFGEFFRHMPVTSGMGFVLIQHLPPDHTSLLAEILSKYTQMPVMQVEDGM